MNKDEFQIDPCWSKCSNLVSFVINNEFLGVLKIFDMWLAYVSRPLCCWEVYVFDIQFVLVYVTYAVMKQGSGW